MGYTKGPWFVDKLDPSTIIDGSERTSDASDVAYMNQEKENWDDEWDGDWRDNARLIAASPDLLEALKAITRIDDYEPDCNKSGDFLTARDIATEAIRKAEGK